MSRHEHHKKKTHVGPKGAKKSASKRSAKSIAKTTSSSDDDYAGVDLISDTSDGDEEDVDKKELSMILDSLSPGRVEESDGELEDSMGEDNISFDGFELPPYLDDDYQGHFDDSFLMTNHDMGFADVAHFENATDGDHADQALEHVHSSSGSNSDSDDSHPFFALDSLAPDFQIAIGGNDEAVPSSDASSCWDLEAERGQQLHAQNEHVIEDDNGSGSDSGSLSGYETDVGETTEEDENPERKRIPPQRSVLRRLSPQAEEKVPVRRSKKTTRPPRMGIFTEVGEKPFGTTDATNGRLLLWVAEKKRDPIPNAMQDGVHMNDLFRESYDPFGGFLADDFPHLPSFESSSHASYDEDDDEDKDSDLQLEDYIDFGPSDTDAETGIGGDANEAPSSTPARAPAGETNVLSHLNRGNVAVFRNHQRQHALLSRNAATTEGLAFKNTLGNGPIRGIKSGRLAAANTPITPARKQKGVKNVAASSPGSPLARARQKLSGKVTKTAHKRNRSLY